MLSRLILPIYKHIFPLTGETAKSSLHRTHEISQTQAMSRYYKSAVAVCSCMNILLSEFNIGKTPL